MRQKVRFSNSLNFFRLQNTHTGTSTQECSKNARSQKEDGGVVIKSNSGLGICAYSCGWPVQPGFSYTSTVM